MEMNKYASLFIQIRLLADELGDERSLVALAAQFEREADEILRGLERSIAAQSHRRNSAA
jgi:hypothetical protein